MPIPSFNHNHVIPPHAGNPTLPTHLSPYDCTVIELCQTFSTSKPRIDILKGLLYFRQKMNTLGIIDGFQWLDGSFLENIEATLGRPPKDLDLVTFFNSSTIPNRNQVLSTFPEFISPALSRSTFKLDHYPIDYTVNPDATVEMTRYWIQLFTHNRHGVWKGILKLPLNTPNDDQQALTYLNSK